MTVAAAGGRGVQLKGKIGITVLMAIRALIGSGGFVLIDIVGQPAGRFIIDITVTRFTETRGGAIDIIIPADVTTA